MKIKTIPILKKFGKPLSGCECMFVRTSKTRGVKIFCSKREVTYSYKKQKLAAKHGIAPRVLSNIQMCYTKNLKKYNEYDGEVVITRPYGYFYRTEFAKYVGSTRCICADICHLVDKMKELNLHSGDLHENNIGFIRGKLVCIDFGKESVS